MKSVGKHVVHHVMSKLHNNKSLMFNVHINVRNNIYSQVCRQITLQLIQNI